MSTTLPTALQHPITQPKPLPNPLSSLDSYSPRTKTLPAIPDLIVVSKPLPVPGSPKGVTPRHKNSPRNSPRGTPKLFLPVETGLPAERALLRERSKSDGKPVPLPTPKPRVHDLNLSPRSTKTSPLPSPTKTLPVSTGPTPIILEEAPTAPTSNNTTPRKPADLLFPQPKPQNSPQRSYEFSRVSSERGTSSSEPARKEKRGSAKPEKHFRERRGSENANAGNSTPTRPHNALRDEIGSLISKGKGKRFDTTATEEDQVTTEETELLEREGVELMRERLEKPRKVESLTQWKHGKFSYKELYLETKEFKQFLHFFIKYLGGSALVLNIDTVKLIYSKRLLRAFKNELKTMMNRHMASPKTFNSKKWQFMANQEDVAQKTHVYQKFVERVAQFPWNTDAVVPIIPVVHGTDQVFAQKICEEGFANTSMIDAGYYGSGIYFTGHSLYALPYIKMSKNPCLVVSMVIPGNPYPVTEAHKDPTRSLIGGALKPGYQSHYVLTDRQGLIASPNSPEVYDELVIVIPYQALPVAVIELTQENFETLMQKWNRPLAPTPNIEPEKTPSSETSESKRTLSSSQSNESKSDNPAKYTFLVLFNDLNHKVELACENMDDLYSHLQTELCITNPFQIEFLDPEFNEYVILKTLSSLPNLKCKIKITELHCL